ncbi:MAG TPA: CDP-glycerol glycerophosphotransferase family protein [Candidatus Hydrogenedentes bacterium]|nr:CDP-glycerol glycerophosphotransferase family protein [Candidatus Hydrogenedentota bacterium]
MKLSRKIKDRAIRWIKRHPALDRILWQVVHSSEVDDLVRRHQVEIARLEASQEMHARMAWASRALFKGRLRIPIKVLFVCHEPALWPMYESIFDAMLGDPTFDPLVVAMPISNTIRAAGDDMFSFCKAGGIRAIQGYDPSKGSWLDPVSLMPDYLFMQTPYSFYPPVWQADALAMHARLCYVPYATSIFQGEVDDILHPESYMRRMAYIFKESSLAKERFVRRFGTCSWFKPESVVVTGSPKLDFVKNALGTEAGGASGPGAEERVRILWTPRWRTEEGVCHFFEYKDYFVRLCRRHPRIDFVFRPHPLMFKNLLQTGELTPPLLEALVRTYETAPNMTLDVSADYRKALLSADILISDVSSLIWEYMPLDKPVIYTHRTHVFNEIGDQLAEGCYWASDEAELDSRIAQLMDGQDPLAGKRRAISQALYCFPPEGVGECVKNVLKVGFSSAEIAFPSAR